MMNLIENISYPSVQQVENQHYPQLINIELMIIMTKENNFIDKYIYINQNFTIIIIILSLKTILSIKI